MRKAISYRVAKESDYQVIKFKQFGQRFLVGPKVLVDAYSEGDTYAAPETMGIGRNAAIAQERYLVDLLIKGITNRTKLSTFTGKELVDVIESFGLLPDIVFLPIDYYSALAMHQLQGISISFEGQDRFLLIGKMKIHIFWPNNYVPFKRDDSSRKNVR